MMSFKEFISESENTDLNEKLQIPSHLKTCIKEALKIFKKHGFKYLKGDTYEDNASVINWTALFKFEYTYMKFEIFLMKDIDYRYQVMLNYVNFGGASGGITGGSVDSLSKLGKALNDAQNELLNIRITE